MAIGGIVSTNMTPQHKDSSISIAKVPDGFTIGIGADGQQYLVPQHMVPALDQAFASYRTKVDLGVARAPGGVSDPCPYCAV
jgi:hypothetical protein